VKGAFSTFLKKSLDEWIESFSHDPRKQTSIHPIFSKSTKEVTLHI